MRDIRFTFLCSSAERYLLNKLAKHLKRTQSDTIRLLIWQESERRGIEYTEPEEGENYKGRTDVG